jgi:hypothetical protein
MTANILCCGGVCRMASDHGPLGVHCGVALGFGSFLVSHIHSPMECCVGDLCQCCNIIDGRGAVHGLSKCRSDMWDSSGTGMSQKPGRQFGQRGHTFLGFIRGLVGINCVSPVSAESHPGFWKLSRSDWGTWELHQFIFVVWGRKQHHEHRGRRPHDGLWKP